jgi:hypothetical protein
MRSANGFMLCVALPITVYPDLVEGNGSRAARMGDTDRLSPAVVAVAAMPVAAIS